MSRPSIHSRLNRGKKYPDCSWLDVATEDPDYLRRHILNKKHVPEDEQNLARQALTEVGEPIRRTPTNQAETPAPAPAVPPSPELAVVARQERAFLVRDHAVRLLGLHALAVGLAVLGWGVQLGLIAAHVPDKAMVLLMTGTAILAIWVLETATHRRYQVLLRDGDVADGGARRADHAYVERFPVHAAFAAAGIGSVLAIRGQLVFPAHHLALPAMLVAIQFLQLLAPWRIFGRGRPSDEHSRMAQWVALVAFNLIRLDRWFRGRDERQAPTRKQVFKLARALLVETGVTEQRTARKQTAPRAQRRKRVKARTPLTGLRPADLPARSAKARKERDKSQALLELPGLNSKN